MDLNFTRLDPCALQLFAQRSVLVVGFIEFVLKNADFTNHLLLVEVLLRTTAATDRSRQHSAEQEQGECADSLGREVAQHVRCQKSDVSMNRCQVNSRGVWEYQAASAEVNGGFDFGVNEGLVSRGMEAADHSMPCFGRTNPGCPVPSPFDSICCL